jgi:hypothetical protein
VAGKVLHQSDPEVITVPADQNGKYEAYSYTTVTIVAHVVGFNQLDRDASPGRIVQIVRRINR